jgi:SAM-dependent methyltransferase
VFAGNIEDVMGRIAPTDVVLDVGGWARPFTRADYVVDLQPYESRAISGRDGGTPERFTRDSWIIHDVCGAEPLPFDDKAVDFVVCSHTLEDVRDPLRVCRELQRVAKRGYIEVPSRIVESTVGAEGRRYAGYYHHRWLVDVEANGLVFRFKSDLIHESFRYHLSRSSLKRLRAEDRISFLFWEGDFDCVEVIQIARVEVARDLESFVESRLTASDRFRRYPRMWAAAVVRRLRASSAEEASPEREWTGMPETRSR